MANRIPSRWRQGRTVPTDEVPSCLVSFMRFCTDLKFGEIERLSIQNGLPVLAETTKKKVKFIAD